jgi:hypothetical protein
MGDPEGAPSGAHVSLLCTVVRAAFCEDSTKHLTSDLIHDVNNLRTRVVAHVQELCAALDCQTGVVEDAVLERLKYVAPYIVLA